MLHRAARVQSGEAVLVHGAAGRVGTAALELGRLAGLRLSPGGTAVEHRRFDPGFIERRFGRQRDGLRFFTGQFQQCA